MAFDASAVGNTMEKFPAVEVLSEPKSRTQTDLFALLLL
jgi:hypothetical protein